jgi:hypothetical protein
MYIEEIVGTSEQLGDIYRILISPNEIMHLMQLEKYEFESIMKGLFIHFKMDSVIIDNKFFFIYFHSENRKYSCKIK